MYPKIPTQIKKCFDPHSNLCLFPFLGTVMFDIFNLPGRLVPVGVHREHRRPVLRLPSKHHLLNI